MIRIEVIAYKDKPVAQSISADFDTGGGTIGRSPDNTLVLLDPERKISRTHASLAYAGGSYVLRDQGSIVPVVLNGQPIGNGRESPIAPGDEIRIAGYAMRVRSAAAEDAVPPTPDPLNKPLDIEVPATAEPPVQSNPVPAAAPPPIERQLEVATSEQPAAETEPEVAAPAPRAAESELQIGAPPQSATETEREEVAAPQPASEGESDETASRGTEMAEPVLSWTGSEESGSIDATTTIILSPAGRSFMEHDDGQRDASAFAPTEATAAEPATTGAARRDEGAPLSTNDALLRALLNGASIRAIDVPGGLTPQLMSQLGSLLREAVHGLLDLLAARAMTKREVRADMTVIVAKDNNPLKFSPDMEAALTHLLVPRGKGFMPPLRAVSDAYDDLRAHQLGFMAGMRSALTVVLARFDPRALEHKMQGTSVVDSILPTHRKAKLWDLFAELYGTISKDAQNDFHALFGREFLRAYQAHVAKLPERGESVAAHGPATHDSSKH